MRSASRNPIACSKLLCALFIVIFYLCYIQIHPPARTQGKPLPKRLNIQHDKWDKNEGKADVTKRAKIKAAMKHTYDGYRQKAWGKDEVKPISGDFNNTRNGWGATIIDGASTLVMMGMWDELKEALEHIIQVDFGRAEGLVDPFETTIRYIGGMLSIVELGDAGQIPSTVYTKTIRSEVLRQTRLLADKVLLAFDDHTGLPWPRIDFHDYMVSPPQASIGPARAGSNFLELCTLSKLTGDPEYCSVATIGWSSLVRNKYVEDIPGLVDGKMDVTTGELVGRDRHWDAGHDSYYEYLIKGSLLLPDSPNAKVYRHRWTQAADAVRNFLVTRSAPYRDSAKSHLYMGKWDGAWYVNEMSHLACFAPGNLFLGARVLQRRDLVVLAQALLEGCRHTYDASPLGIGPEKFSWTPSAGSQNATFGPQSARQHAELDRFGIWVADPRYRLRPEYVESLFYAYRTTGEERYREWGWNAFEAMEKHCKTTYGYAAIKDVMAGKGAVELLDEAESFWAAETLKYLYLLFDDVSVGSLDDWIFSTEGHLFRAR